MPHDIPDAESAGRDREARGRQSPPWDRFLIGAVLVLSPAVAASAVASGASPAWAAVLMVLVIVAGIFAARALTSSGQQDELKPTSFGTSASYVARRPLTPLERQLSSRYGVWVEQVAGHVWRVDGELVEAILEEDTGRLMAGQGELVWKDRHPH